jgi:hypothetical protein
VASGFASERPEGEELSGLSEPINE